MRTRMTKFLFRPVALLGLVYAGLALFGAGCTDALIFPAPRPSYDGYLPGLVKLSDGEGGEIAAIWLPSDGSDTAVLYFHGNGEDLGHIRPTLEELRRETGCSVFAVDYPGYGLSSGSPSEDGCYHAANMALAKLSSDYGYRADSVVVFGRSLGTGVAVDLAARKRVKGLVLVAPYTSTFRVVTKVKVLPMDRFDNLAKIERITCPLFVAHGDADEVIPWSQGRQLFESAENSKDKKFLTLQGLHHNDDIPMTQTAAYWDGVRHVTGSAPAGI